MTSGPDSHWICFIPSSIAVLSIIKNEEDHGSQPPCSGIIFLPNSFSNPAPRTLWCPHPNPGSSPSPLCLNNIHKTCGKRDELQPIPFFPSRAGTPQIPVFQGKAGSAALAGFRSSRLLLPPIPKSFQVGMFFHPNIFHFSKLS